MLEPVAETRTSAVAALALVCGIMEVALFVVALRSEGDGSNNAYVLSILVFSPLAMVLGIVGIVRSGRRAMRGRAMAVVGLILGLVPWILFALYIALLAAGDYKAG